MPQIAQNVSTYARYILQTRQQQQQPRQPVRSTSLNAYKKK